MAGRPGFTEDDAIRFARFLEAVGRRIREDADFRRSLLGRGRDIEAAGEAVVPLDVAEQDPPVEFRETDEHLTATVTLPPGLERDNVRVSVSRRTLSVDVVGEPKRGFSFELPCDVSGAARATLRNRILDVVMTKEAPEGRRP